MFLKFNLLASSFLIKPEEDFSPNNVFFDCSSSPSTLTYIVAYFKSVVTSASVTLVIGATLGSFTSPLIISDTVFITSEFIIVDFKLFFLIHSFLLLSWNFYHIICFNLVKFLDIVELLKYKTAFVACSNFLNIVFKSLK